MAKWSNIRHRLENEYLAECLRGHIQYYATTYSRSPDHEGRAAIRLDGKEIIRGCYWNFWLLPYEERWDVTDTSIKVGSFDQRTFYRSFEEFDSQSIEDSLCSDNLIVRIFAILDRRVGKRRLTAMLDTIGQEPDTFKEFYAIRMKAEGLTAPLPRKE